MTIFETEAERMKAEETLMTLKVFEIGEATMKSVNANLAEAQAEVKALQARVLELEAVWLAAGIITDAAELPGGSTTKGGRAMSDATVFETEAERMKADDDA